MKPIPSGIKDKGMLKSLKNGINTSNISAVCAGFGCWVAITYNAIPAPNDATEVQKNFLRAGKPALSL